MNKERIQAIIGIIIIVVIALWFFGQKNWMLSLYSNGITILRIDYKTEEACLSAGHSYKSAGSADRFDCGYKCEDSIDLTQGILCKEVIRN